MNSLYKADASIIVPVANGESTIERCIDSIYDNISKIECIVIVNNSTDRTNDVLDELKKKYKQLKVINSEASGTSEARNIGLDYVTTDFVGFCDSDDYFEPNSIDNILQLMSDKKADILFTGINRLELHDCGVKKISPKKYKEGVISSKKALPLILNDMYITGSVCNKFYKRSVIENHRFDVKLTHCEDLHFNAVILKENRVVALSNYVFYNYVYNGCSVTNDADKCFDESGCLKYRYAVEKIKKEFVDEKIIQLECAYLLYVMSVQNYSRKLSKERKKYIRKSLLKNIYSVFLLSKNGFYRNTKLLIKGIMFLIF